VIRRPGAVLVPAITLALLSASAASAQNLGLGSIDQGDGHRVPVNITADNGIEWRQSEHVYIARGNVKTVRGNVTVYADEMRAFYRPTAKSAADKAKAAAAPPPAVTPAADKNAGPKSVEDGATEVYRLEAAGNVKFVTETQTAYGERAVYDVDQTLLIMTGRNLKVVTLRDVVTARDSMEWYDSKQLGVARGDAVDLHDGKRISADVLVAHMVHPQGQEAHIERVDADGHVFVSSQDQIGRGDQGVYNADAGTVTLTGNVRLTRNQNEMRGEYGVVDLNRNVGHLLPAPPGTPVAAGAPRRVQGLIVPTNKPGQTGKSALPGSTVKPGT
jgi:lipopolysaccharide export system protein LptA